MEKQLSTYVEKCRRIEKIVRKIKFKQPEEKVFSCGRILWLKL